MKFTAAYVSHQCPVIRTLAFGLLALSISAAAAAQSIDKPSAAAKKTVLILTSERNELPAVATIEAGLREEFANRKEDVQIFVEYLDFGRFPAQQHGTELVRYLASRYPARTIQAVVPLFEGALDFAVSNRARLFPNVPIVGAAIDETWLQTHELPAGVAAIPMVYDYRRTLELMRAINPELKQVEVVHGVSEYDLRRRDEARKVLETSEPKLAYRMVGAIPLAAIEQEVKGLPPTSAVLLLSMVRDAEGKAYVGRDVAARLAAVSPVPIFGTFASHLEYGTLGGAITDFAEIGRRAGTVLTGVFAGSVPSGAIKGDVAPTSLRVTWRGLQRWNILDSRVPPDVQIIGRPPSMWQQYRATIIGGAFALILQAILIVLLLTELGSRREAEETLRDSESRFQSMADTAPVMIWMAGPDKLGTYVNKVWLEFTGKTAEEERGHGWTKGVHPDDRRECLATYESAFDACHEFRMEYRLRRHDGEYRWIHAEGVPRFTANGKFLGYIGSCLDITERKQSEERLRLAVTALPIAIVMINMEGAIVLANAAAEKVFGYSPGALNGLPINKLLPELQWAGHFPDRAELFANSQKRPAAAGFNLYAARKDGSEFMAEVGLNPIQEDGGMLVLTSVIDMTERNELQHSRQELAHVSRIAAMGELAGSLAHELNQPLTAILTNAQAVQRYMNSDKFDLADVREVMPDLVHDSNRAAEIIRRMRAFVKKSEFEATLLDAGGVVRDVVALVHSDVIVRGVRVVMEIADKLPAVEGDRIQLQQVVLNLLLNAFDAMKDLPQSQRVVTAQVIAFGTSGVQIAVRDSGPGIGAADLERVFTPFFTTKRDGLGLGLSICRSILEAHGARLSVQNNADRGAIFSFVLPVTAGALVAGQAA